MHKGGGRNEGYREGHNLGNIIRVKSGNKNGKKYFLFHSYPTQGNIKSRLRTSPDCIGSLYSFHNITAF